MLPEIRAYAISEFTPDRYEPDQDGRPWIFAKFTESDNPNEYPKVVEYDGLRYYFMSYNSDSMEVAYAASQGKPYHLRYSS